MIRSKLQVFQKQIIQSSYLAGGTGYISLSLSLSRQRQICEFVYRRSTPLFSPNRTRLPSHRSAQKISPIQLVKFGFRRNKAAAREREREKKKPIIKKSSRNDAFYSLRWSVRMNAACWGCAGGTTPPDDTWDPINFGLFLWCLDFRFPWEIIKWSGLVFIV